MRGDQEVIIGSRSVFTFQNLGSSGSATMTSRSSLLLLSWSRFCGSRTLCSLSGTSPLPPARPSRRYLSGPVKVRSYLQYVKRRVLAPPTPPYSYVCQVGDPVLRSRAAAVDPAAVTGPEVQEVLATMMKVMRKLECVGLSAPQVGVPLRILMLEVPWRRFEEVPAAAREARRLSVEPLRIFVNPELRVLDSGTVLFQEACESISGFSASVPRYLAVEVSGLNEKGEEVSWKASGWSARILQHEMDHLDGILYIDRMDTRSFINIHWQEHE